MALVFKKGKGSVADRHKDSGCFPDISFFQKGDFCLKMVIFFKSFRKIPIGPEIPGKKELNFELRRGGEAGEKKPA